MSEPDEAAIPQSPFEGIDEADLLAGSDRLTPAEANTTLRGSRGKLILWAGERGSGKTTLSTGFYELQRLPNPELSFVGSRTLLGFEKLLHPTRAASGRTDAVTRRTELDPEQREILHLKLAKRNEHVNLLFADLPGETWQRLADNQIDVNDIPLIQRADNVGIIVDGAKLANPRDRPMALIRALQLVGKLTGAVDSRTEFAIVVTKWDRLREDAAAVDYWTPRREQIAEAMRGLSDNVRTFHVSARSDDGHEGMNELREWLLQHPTTIGDPALDPLVDNTLMTDIKRPRTLVAR